MLDESDIAAECSPASFSRARSLAKKGRSVIDRRCTYGRNLSVDAYVKSSSGYADEYDCNVTLSKDENRIVDYWCSCPAYRKYPGMCKHSAAVAMVFLEHPETFRGYAGAAKRETKTSPALQRLLEASFAPAAQRGQSAESRQAPGTLWLELTLEHNASSLTATFKICSPTASYVLKSVSDLLFRIQMNEFFQYGKKMAFVHSMSMFTPHTQKVIELLQRMEESSFGRSKYGRHFYGGANMAREVYLFDHEAIDLLDLYRDMPFFYDNGTTLNRNPVAAHVEEGNPPIALHIVALEAGGYEILRDKRLTMLSFGSRSYAICENTFYRCSPSFTDCARFLQKAYCSWDTRLLISEADATRFCATLLPQLRRELEVEAPSQLNAIVPKPLTLRFYLDKQGSSVVCRALACYGEDEMNLLTEEGSQKVVVRDYGKEGEALSLIARLMPGVTVDGMAQALTDDEVGQLLFGGIAELRRLGEVFTTPALDRMVSTAAPRVSTGVSLVGNLINLQVKPTEVSPEELLALLSSYHAKKRFHKLSDGSYLSIAGTAADDMGLPGLSSLMSGIGLTDSQLLAGHADLPLALAFLLDSQLDEEDSRDESFNQLLNDLKGSSVSTHRLPSGLKDVLRPYQREGFRWINTLADRSLAGILADEMGLGKSLQVISFLAHRKKELDRNPAVIVCPASLVYNWKAEFQKFAPGMRVALAAGTKAQRSAARATDAHVLVTSYESLRIDEQEWAKGSYFACILDEAQYIKNHAAKVTKAVKKVQAAHRLALTGTPVENRLSELWSIFDFLMPGVLGSYVRFKERYELPIVGGDEAASQRLRSLVGPFILRRRKADVLADLPEKLEQVIRCPLQGEQLKLYNAHEQRLRMQLDSKTDDDLAQDRIAVLAELTHLRQICCDPRLLYSNAKHPGAKLEAICDLVAAAMDSGQKTLLFSQFTSFLSLIAEELSKRGIAFFTITGKTPKKKRVELVDIFNADATPVFLISLKAGGTGLNLTGASIVIHADPWWNAAAQNQATDRAHRIGQTRDVTVYQVIAQDSIEERILDLQLAKADLADQVLSGSSTNAAALSREELIGLLTQG